MRQGSIARTDQPGLINVSHFTSCTPRSAFGSPAIGSTDIQKSGVVTNIHRTEDLEHENKPGPTHARDLSEHDSQWATKESLCHVNNLQRRAYKPCLTQCCLLRLCPFLISPVIILRPQVACWLPDCPHNITSIQFRLTFDMSVYGFHRDTNSASFPKPLPLLLAAIGAPPRAPRDREYVLVLGNQRQGVSRARNEHAAFPRGDMETHPNTPFSERAADKTDFPILENQLKSDPLPLPAKISDPRPLACFQYHLCCLCVIYGPR